MRSVRGLLWVCLACSLACTNPASPNEVSGPRPEPGTHVEDTTCDVVGELAADTVPWRGVWRCVRASRDLAADEVGFFRVRERRAADAERGERRVPEGEIFYLFQRADDAPENKPLVVVFNGGPIAATTPVLLARGVARSVVSPLGEGAWAPARNPSAWTRFANVLFVDAKHAGFSAQSLDPAPSWSSYSDASEVARLLMGFVARRHTELRETSVLAGESYGGVRVGRMLEGLLFGYRYGDGEAVAYEDEHFTAAREEFLRALNLRDTPWQLGRFFAAQVHLQGLWSSRVWSPWGVPTACLPETASAEPACTSGGFGFDIRDPSQSFSDSIPDALFWADRAGVAALFAFPEEALTGLGLWERPFATIATVRPDPSWGGFEGAGDTGAVDALGELFVDTARYTDAFISDAKYDAIVTSNVAPEVLGALVGSEDVDVLRADDPRARTIRVHGLGDEPRDIAFPLYDAGHMITFSDAENLAADVERFVQRLD